MTMWCRKDVYETPMDLMLVRKVSGGNGGLLDKEGFVPVSTTWPCSDGPLSATVVLKMQV